MNILLIQASARREGSVTRRLAAEAAARLGGAVTVRDLAEGVPLLDDGFVRATFTAPEARDADDRAALARSDALVAELQAADIVVIGLPIYNFGAPGALKAWFDQVARAGVTFRYAADGPEGLLKGKRAVIVAASGGTAVGSEIDFATPWLTFALGFLGILDVEIIAADRLMAAPENAEAAAAAVGRLAA
jgi:FMN-dependent NADH-azoreductase